MAPAKRESVVPKPVLTLYTVMQSVEARLGGGEGVQGIYGSITASGMQRILDCLHHNCGLGANSRLVDVGAGLGRPLLHAMVAYGLACSYGVEIDSVKVAKAGAFLAQARDALALRAVRTASSAEACGGGGAEAGGRGERSCEASNGDGGASADGEEKEGKATAAAPATTTAAATTTTTTTTTTSTPTLTRLPLITCAPIELLASLEPATHAYSFWEGVPRGARAAFGALFATSRTLRAVAVVQRAVGRGRDPAAEMRSLNFGPLLLLSSFQVSMSGSGRAFTAYVFSKPAPAAAGALLLTRAPALAAAAAADDDGSDGSSDSDDNGDDAAPPRALVQLRTELSVDSEDGAGGDAGSPSGGKRACGDEASPGKRACGGDGGTAAAAATPSTQSAATAVTANGGGYQMRPRRLAFGASEQPTQQPQQPARRTRQAAITDAFRQRKGATAAAAAAAAVKGGPEQGAAERVQAAAVGDGDAAAA